MTMRKVGSETDIPDKGGLGVVVDGLEIAILDVDGEYYAIQNRCVHKGGPMYEGTTNDEKCSVYCPWHAWEFDLETGQSPVDPNARLLTFDVEVRDGEIYIDL